MSFDSIEAVQEAMRQQDYVSDRALATVIFLALKLEKPLLLEGEAGVGKTEVAKVLAAMLGAKLIRLQCYEGLDVNTALYEWNFPRQMLHIKIAEASSRTNAAEIEQEILQRSLLDQAATARSPPRRGWTGDSAVDR